MRLELGIENWLSCCGAGPTGGSFCSWQSMAVSEPHPPSSTQFGPSDSPTAKGDRIPTSAGPDRALIFARSGARGHDRLGGARHLRGMRVGHEVTHEVGTDEVAAEHGDGPRRGYRLSLRHGVVSPACRFAAPLSGGIAVAVTAASLPVPPGSVSGVPPDRCPAGSQLAFLAVLPDHPACSRGPVCVAALPSVTPKSLH